METQTPLDQLGPVDFLVVEFPEETSNFTGEIADELLRSSRPARSGSSTC